MARWCIPIFPEIKYFHAFNKKQNLLMHFGTFVISAAHLLTLQSTPPLLYVSDFHSQAQSVSLTSSRLPEPGCCLSALSHWSHSGSASRWRCAAPGTRTGPWDTCLEGWRKQKTKCTLWKGENSFTWKALTVRASETTCAEGISCLTARPVTAAVHSQRSVTQHLRWRLGFHSNTV